MSLHYEYPTGVRIVFYGNGRYALLDNANMAIYPTHLQKQAVIVHNMPTTRALAHEIAVKYMEQHPELKA